MPLDRPSLTLTSSIVPLVGLLLGCQTAASPAANTPQTFTAQVTQYISENSQFGFSEAELYLTVLGQLGPEKVWDYGDRFCESLRRGGSMKEIADKLQQEQAQQQYSEDEYKTRLFILSTAEQSLCPESSFPPAGWQRSLFFLWERGNGGTSF